MLPSPLTDIDVVLCSGLAQHTLATVWNLADIDKVCGLTFEIVSVLRIRIRFDTCHFCSKNKSAKIKENSLKYVGLKQT